jgi:hypothetical protein
MITPSDDVLSHSVAATEPDLGSTMPSCRTREEDHEKPRTPRHCAALGTLGRSPLATTQRSMRRYGSACRYSTPRASTNGASPASRYATPPVIMLRREWAAAPQLQAAWTLGEFLAAATKNLCTSLPTLGKHACQQPLNFNPR